MEDYAVWTARPLDNNSVAIDIAAAHSSGVGSGSLALCAAALNTFWPGVKAYDCAVTPIRSTFFSDYPDAPDWRDRWRIGWNLMVKIDGPVPASVFHFPYSWLHEPDPTWDGKSQVSDEVATAIVFAGAPNVTRSDLPTAFATVDPKNIIISKLERMVLPRLDGTKADVIRAEISVSQFSDQVGQLDAFIRGLKKFGWHTNWREFL